MVKKNEKKSSESHGVRFVPLPNLPGRVYAEMVQNVLKEKNIPCYMHGDGFLEAYQVSGSSAVGGGMRLYVPEDRYEECVELQRTMMDHI